MLDHVGIEVKDYDTSKQFYTKVLQPIGYELLMEVAGFAGFGCPHTQKQEAIATFWLHEGLNPSTRTHFAFCANNRQVVDEFYKAAISAGGKDNGKPGIRSIYHDNYYGAFVFDPDGNNIEVVCHKAVNEPTKGIKPEDILADGQDTANFNGRIVRKGTVKAAIENVKIFESKTASTLEKQAAKDAIKNLVPDLIALDVYQYLRWNNSEIQALCDELATDECLK